jgi:DNA-binding XRE family transcriptional regulator
MRLTNLRRVRERRASSQADAGARGDVGQTTVIRAENGREADPRTMPQAGECAEPARLMAPDREVVAAMRPLRAKP